MPAAGGDPAQGRRLGCYAGMERPQVAQQPGSYESSPFFTTPAPAGRGAWPSVSSRGLEPPCPPRGLPSAARFILLDRSRLGVAVAVRGRLLLLSGSPGRITGPARYRTDQWTKVQASTQCRTPMPQNSPKLPPGPGRAQRNLESAGNEAAQVWGRNRVWEGRFGSQHRLVHIAGKLRARRTQVAQLWRPHRRGLLPDLKRTFWGVLAACTPEHAQPGCTQPSSPLGLSGPVPLLVQS